MGPTRTPRVLVLYVHPLLGQGMARLLTAQAGVRAVAIAAADDTRRSAALQTRPDLVIVEEAGDMPAVPATDSLPVVFVRINTDDGGQLGEALSDPDLIVALARGLADVSIDGAERPHRHLAVTGPGER